MVDATGWEFFFSKNALVHHARNGILVAKTHGREAIFAACIPVMGWSPLQHKPSGASKKPANLPAVLGR
jgi:hypothetical protein